MEASSEATLLEPPTDAAVGGDSQLQELVTKIDPLLEQIDPPAPESYGSEPSGDLLTLEGSKHPLIGRAERMVAAHASGSIVGRQTLGVEDVTELKELSKARDINGLGRFFSAYDGRKSG